VMHNPTRMVAVLAEIKKLGVRLAIDDFGTSYSSLAQIKHFLIREGKANLRDGYALVRNGELWLINVHISPWRSASAYFNHEPRRTRKLLMHKQEIRKLIGKVEEKGLTLVPLKMYLKGGWVKLDIGLGKGKKLYDKREDMKKRDDKRDMERAMKQF